MQLLDPALRLRDLHLLLHRTPPNNVRLYASTGSPDRNLIPRLLAELVEQPYRPNRRMAAHIHLVLWDPKTEYKVAV